MGRDGVEGLQAVKAAGGRVLAQDEPSSVVYGMPGEAVAAGVVDAVLAVDEMGPRLAELIAGGSDANARPRR
jgi:two-component system chemotaxis response regulator CheB